MCGRGAIKEGLHDLRRATGIHCHFPPLSRPHCHLFLPVLLYFLLMLVVFFFFAFDATEGSSRWSVRICRASWASGLCAGSGRLCFCVCVCSRCSRDGRRVSVWLGGLRGDSAGCELGRLPSVGTHGFAVRSPFCRVRLVCSNSLRAGSVSFSEKSDLWLSRVETRIVAVKGMQLMRVSIVVS